MNSMRISLGLAVLILGVGRLGGSSHAQEASSSKFQLPASDEGLAGQGPIRRYDWFKRLWVERRARWAERVERDAGAVVFLGDSITQGWGDDFSGWWPGLKAANRGISGDTSRGVLLRLREDVLALKPRGVVLLIGTNDLEEKAEPETIAGNLPLILDEIGRQDPKLPVVLCQVFPSSAAKSRPSDKIKKLNRLYAEAVRARESVTLVETWTLYADDQGDAPASEFPDLLHLNQAGYAKWASALRPVFATLGWVETETYEFAPEPGFESLFNGRDLTGWGYRVTSEADKESARKWKASDPSAPPWPVVEAPVAFDGKSESRDGRYRAIRGRLVVATPSEGRKIQQLYTTRDFPEDFVLRLEFRATPNADSGIFIRGRQLQCRDYPLAGPYKKLRNYRPGGWNEIEVTVKGGVAFCLCNGEVIEEAMKVPETGPIGLEGDRGQMEYRRLRIRALR
ncbi:MAG: DUF1080 domain-containing protein [Verrucomicrobia bacterium]|nr:DUF1080 domain-containing protein [Verrucomicrobiota bacterium]